MSSTARNARLLFGPDVDVRAPEAAALLRPRRVAPLPVRMAQRAAMKAGRLDYERHVLAPLIAARRAALGPAAAGPPRLLVRVDEYPHASTLDEPGRFGDDAFRRFADIMAEAGVPYLLAVTPRPCHDYRNPAATGDRPMSDVEAATLAGLGDVGVTLALHGLTHRTRDARPRHHSELIGLDEPGLERLLDDGQALIAERLGRPTQIFVPPFNRFGPRQYATLARRFAVVCGGPETVPQLGFHSTPTWLGEAVYLPGYAPLYGSADAVAAGLDRIEPLQPGTWLPVVLHWGWEADAGWAGLRRLAPRLGRLAERWDTFLAAVAASAAPSAPAEQGETLPA